MGINPATSLTQDLSPEQSADILLLGCGDPRHILYTVSTDVTCRNVPRQLDITCCDIEPAVLARNILLFSLLEDDTPSNHVWDIFYHFKLTEHAFGLVATQSRKLADLAASPQTWRESGYGSFLKMVDAASLSELRRYWNMYADFPDISSNRLEKLQAEQETLSNLMSGRAKTGMNAGASRSATVVWRQAMKPVNDQFAHYWEHGTTVTTNKDIKKTTKLNPTFCYSSLGETFKIYDSTFPQGYHFAPAFTPIEVDPAGPATNSAMIKAKQQFKASCVALQAFRSSNRITLRFFVGDALALCRALKIYAKTKTTNTQEFAAPWRATPIDLSENAASSPTPPELFDVIDCSLLASQLGLLNFLLACQPLLKTRPASQAVVYTDLPMQVGFSIDGFLERLCGSVPSIGILIGLVPRPYVSLFSSQSNTHELIISNDVTMYMERIAWVDPVGGDTHTYTEPSSTVCFEYPDIARMLFSVYRSMFYFDTVPSQEIDWSSDEELKILSSPHYSRETVAMLVAHAKSRVELVQDDKEANWWSAMTGVLGFIALHGEQYGMNNYFHDLQNHLRLLGVPFKAADERFELDVLATELFSGWKEVPPRIMCVVLIVPSDKLDLLRQDKTEPSPRLVCNFGHSNAGGVTMTHTSIQAVWGKCVPIPDSDGNYAIEEDPQGHRGQSDLVVSFWADAEMMAFNKVTVSLSLYKTPLVLKMYRKDLGASLDLFTATAADKERLLVLRERPMGSAQTQRSDRFEPQPYDPVTASGIKWQIKVVDDGPRCLVDSIVAHFPVTSSAARAELSKGAKVKVVQVGPCTLQLGWKKSTHILRFPYPLRGTDANARVTKTANAINVKVPVFKPVEAGGYPFNMFPIVWHTHFSPWNIHHLHIDRMPKIDVQQRDSLRWLLEHTTIQFSDRERVVQRSTHATQRRGSDVLVNVKESISVLIQDYVGIREGPQATFGLVDTKHGYFVFIFVGSLRLDLAGATVALDVALVPIHLEGAKLLDPGVTTLDALAQIMQIRTRPAEVVAWKQLLPSFVERCRTWSHRPDCRYKSTGQVPLSVNVEVNPLCACGQGIGFDAPEWQVPAWKGLLPFATRAVISPLFGVSYLEVIAGPAAKMHDVRKPISWGEPPDVCWQCGGLRLGKQLKRCQQCKKARYCSKECQELHWKAEHKLMCSKLASAR
ncbi:MYND finger protein [Ceratobasidium theobromae]|uniref:MYND finger protein n=1 Tax=Ceratobasidium theobromae TaxID=1582974 RepID=A0A5N5QKR2_9AGAM|nr:MYND finger protein [Ceratobasidium theobromae]